MRDISEPTEKQSIKFSSLNNLNGFSCEVFHRNSGFSKGKYESLNLSYKVGDSVEDVTNNRKLIDDKLKIAAQNLYFPDQCHTNHVKIIDKYTTGDDLMETDALITNRKDLGIGVLAADCVPVVFYDPIRKVIAVAHAGWKGTVKRIVQKVVSSMVQNFSCSPEDILVGIGPAISQKNYEVGDEVFQEVLNLGAEFQDYLLFNPGKTKAHLDLQGTNQRLLLNSGIQGKNMDVLRICTFENSTLLFSARRDGFSSGRFGLVATMF